MCGIVGVYHRDDSIVEEELLSNMVNSIRHRGPDGQACCILDSGRVGLGHARLAIIDLSDYARQPMQTGDERYTITYNGELYNYKELRKELSDKGYHFFSNSDTEVVLNAFACWRENCLIHFNGMFAFAIWDNKEKELFLARDRYGIKPLYYYGDDKKFIIASEQKAILQHPGIKSSLNLDILKEYFTFQNIFSPETFIRDIHLLEAGSYIKLNPNSGVRQIRYWDYQFMEPEQNLSETDYMEELERLFRQAVKRQLVSDVPVGSYLSGGMDSGSITAVMAKERPYAKSFTCGFDLHSASGIELTYDERDKAEYMSYLFKTEHYEMVLKAGDMERCMKKLVWHIEDPRVGQSYPNYYAAQLSSKFVKVILSGAGGDELFGGYPWRYYRSVNNENFEEYIDKYFEFWQRLVPADKVRRLFNPIWNEVKHVDERRIFKKVFKSQDKTMVSPEQCVNHSMYFEAKTFLHGLLVVEDKLSMAHSLETRVPFLDNDLVDFAMKLPVSHKLKNLKEISLMNENETSPKTEKYFKKTNDGKVLFRKAMNKMLPQDILKAEKQGFSAPDASWFKGESIDYVKSIVSNSNSKIYNFLDKGTVKELVNEHITGKNNHRLFIWSILNFEEWCNLFL